KELDWIRPWDRVLEWKSPDAKWFVGGKINASANCLDRHVRAARRNKAAIIWEGEPGDRRTLSYGELDREVSRLAGGLRRLGVQPGDRVGIFMPMCPEVAIAVLATVKIGAVIIPLFSGYGPEAIATRLRDGQAKVLICADGFYRRGQVVAMKETADRALVNCPSVKKVIVHRRVVREIPWTHGRDEVWEVLLEDQQEPMRTEELNPEDPMMIIYTSGTTGKPKGTLHVHGGFPIKAAQDMVFGFDVGPDDIVFWFTDLGWMMGPWLIFGTLILGATMVLYEGTPDFPAPNRLWRMVEDHKVTVLGVSPTLVRGLMTHGDEIPLRHDLLGLRILGGTGEPWNPEPFHWFFKQVGGGRIPIINYTGGTEISGGILSGNVITHLRPTAFAGPVPGIAADVLDADGRSVRGEVGELVIRNPWPGMTRGFWGDRERYLDTYWNRFENVWVHGDWAYVDPDDGLWYVLGRSDDTIKIAGKRLGPAEVESIMVGHRAVAEAAAIGVPDELKGESLVVFVILRPNQKPSDALAAELQDIVASALGKPLRPKAVHFVGDLPRTRNAKILRRVVKSVYTGKDPGDLSSLENPSALAAIGATRA
ncbi:MAG TPA: AMP-binding protein, partial [Candidatus Dormibacteraeota bacterium]|nr:AMP-binding protein [Candidatus Dormibacteraeota bacterium]